MEKTKSDLLFQLLSKFKDIGILKHFIIIGSWCLVFYKDYFDDTGYSPTIRTRDVDFYIPQPFRYKNKLKLNEEIEELGFLTNFKGDEGYISFEHPDLLVEFLVVDKGKGSIKPVEIEGLNINAQSLRYLDIFNWNIISVNYKGIDINVPTPWSFAVHKLLVSTRRKSAEKSENDVRQSVELINYLVDHGYKNEINMFYKVLNNSWKKSVVSVLRKRDEIDILKLLES